MEKNQTTQPRVALITGAARRIGAAIAEALHASGMCVVIHYHTSQTAAEALAAKLNAIRNDSARVHQADLLDTDAYPGLIDAAVQAWGRLDVLINNASRFYKTPWQHVTTAAWDDLLNSNLKAPFFLAQAAAPYLLAEQGVVINIADIHGERPMSDYAPYCIAKAGLIMLTKALAKEFGGRARVNAVAPGGGMVWPEQDEALTHAEKQTIIDRTVLKREGSVSDVAKAVIFLVENADYMTGQVLTIDGGRSLRI